MRWLKKPGRRERGAVAVVVALSMVALMGVVALAVDLGSIYSDRQQLQNGADAAALAIAQSCQRGSTCDTTFGQSTATKYATGNKLDGQATGQLVTLDAAHGTVTVSATSTHTNWFGTVIGAPTTAIKATATANWGFPSGGPTLPLAFSWCAFQNATGGWDMTTGLPNFNTLTVVHIVEHACTPPAHNEVPGGFGSLAGTNCVATVLAGNWVMSDTGNNGPNSCSNFDWTTVMNKPVVIPIFDAVQGTGSNAQYRIKGVAAFTITGLCLGPTATQPTNMPQCPSDKRIQGWFTSYTDLGGSYTIDPNATAFGAGEVKLTA